VTPGLIDSADQVWVMTAAQRRLLLEYAPEARMKVALLDPEGEDIPDPYKQSAAIYERVARQIHRAVVQRVEEIT